MSKSEKNSRKERFEAIEMKFSEPTRLSKLLLDEGNIKMISDDGEVLPESSSYVKFYNRDSGKQKTTLRFDLDKATLDVMSFLDHINVIIALDTNTDLKSNKSVAVAAVFIVFGRRDTYELYFIRSLVYKFINTTEIKSELVALNSLIQAIKEGQIEYILEGDQVLIVVDHNLDKLEQYNKKELPLIDGNATSVLPDNITLAYASTDQYNDSVFNQMLKECDRCASEILKS